MTLKQQILKAKKLYSNTPNTHTIGLLLDWMLEQKYVGAAPKGGGYWGLYGPTYTVEALWRDWIIYNSK